MTFLFIPPIAPQISFSYSYLCDLEAGRKQADDRAAYKLQENYCRNQMDAKRKCHIWIKKKILDYQGIETLQLRPEDWHSIAVILYANGYRKIHSLEDPLTLYLPKIWQNVYQELVQL